MTLTSVTVRPIEFNDVASWGSLRRQLWPHASLTEHEREITEMLSEPNRYAAFIAISQEGQALGFAEAAIRHDYVNGCGTSPVLFLEGVYVVPDARRRGVAKALFGRVEQWGALRGCEEFASDTDVANIDVQTLHRALGFEETERVVFFRKRTPRGTSD
jgi:aminoglycoside 6'-N-acetyltransferase I